jgi:hypothetical protein
MSNGESGGPNWHPKSERVLLGIENSIDDLQERRWCAEGVTQALRSKISDELNTLAGMAAFNTSMRDSAIDVLGSVITNHVAWTSLTDEQRSGLRSLYQQACYAEGFSHDS